MGCDDAGLSTTPGTAKMLSTVLPLLLLLLLLLLLRNVSFWENTQSFSRHQDPSF